MKGNIIWVFAALFPLLFVSCDKEDVTGTDINETADDVEESVSSEDTPAPSLSLTDDSIEVSYHGGSYSFGYTVADATSGGEVSCKSAVSWLGRLDCSEEGAVSFSVDGNGSGEEREGSIILTYSSSAGLAEAQFTVRQAAVGNGKEDADDVIGVYTACSDAVRGLRNGSWTVAGREYDCEPDTWEMKIFLCDDPELDYDLLIDGIIPFTEGRYDAMGDHNGSAGGWYRNGEIVVPCQCYNDITITSLSGTYYLSFMTCTSYDSETGTFYRSTSYPEMVFTYDSSSAQWVSGYGMFVGGCTERGDITSWKTYFAVAAPPVVMTRVSASTAAVSD